MQSATTEAATQTASTVTLTPSYLGLGTGTATFCIGLTPPAGETFSSAEITALNNGVSVTNGSVALLPHCLALETSVGGGVLGIPIDPGAAVNTVTIALPADTVETDASTTDAPEYFAADPLTVNVALDGNTVTAAATPATIVPGAPTIGQVEPIGQKQLNVGWRAPTGTGIGLITGYKVEVSETGTGGWTGIGGTLAATARIYHHGGLTAGTTRYYRVRAVNALGDGAWSAVASGTTEAASTVTNAPPAFTSSDAFSVPENSAVAGTLVAADPDSGDNVVAYSKTGGADEAQFFINPGTNALIFVADPNYESPTDVASTSPANAAGNNEYIVEVAAASGAGARQLTVTQTITVTVTDVAEPPDAPSAPSVQGKTTSDSRPALEVLWSAPANSGRPDITDYDQRYRVLMDPPSGSWTEVTGTTSTLLSATLTGLTASTEYEVQVRATNPEGMSAWSASGRGTTTTTTFSIVPGPSPVTEGEDATFTLTVSPAPSSSTTFTVLYTVSETGDMVAAADEGTGKSIEFDVAGANYSGNVVRIRTDDDSAAETDSVVTVTLATTSGSAAVTVEDNDEAMGPGAPENLAAVPGDGAVTLSWEPPSVTPDPPIARYEYRYKVGTADYADPEVWTEVSGGAAARSVEVTGLANDTEHTFEVRAVNTATPEVSGTAASVTATPAAFTDTITVEAVATPVEEGTAAAFTLARTVSTAALDGGRWR